MNFVPCPNKQAYQDQVWAFVRQVPRGRVVTYGQIMKEISRPEGISAENYQMSAARWVGAAMAACPADVPWHRVVNSQGKISHQSAVADQKKLLVDEGIIFSKEKISLKQYQWQPLERDDAPTQGMLF